MFESNLFFSFYHDFTKKTADYAYFWGAMQVNDIVESARPRAMEFIARHLGLPVKVGCLRPPTPRDRVGTCMNYPRNLVKLPHRRWNPH